MKILRAEHLGMCFGVRDAIALAKTTAERAPLTVLGDLVHNETVLAGLRARGIRFERRAADVQTATVMITAHGTSEKTLNDARQHGLHVLEATCPLVRVAHRSLAKLVAEGYHPLVIGQREHVEVRGLTDDLSAYDIVLNTSDVAALVERDRFGIVAQTTQPIEKVRSLVRLIQARFPRSEVRLIDTVCQPTKQRQTAAVRLAQQCDLVIVIGGAHSNNTRQLVQTCTQYCSHVRHVQTAEELRLEWFADAETVGLTAGTSTPDQVIHDVEATIKSFSVQMASQNEKAYV